MPAHMIPAHPKDFEPASKEGLVFRALETLPEEYYVFHSVGETVVHEGTIYEREIDFVIAHPQKGLLCLEAKAGAHIRYENRTWVYSSGLPMAHGGPYAQIASAKRALRDKIQTHSNPSVRALAEKCRVLHGVLFVDVSIETFRALPGLPEDADERITMFAEDLEMPERKISSIFNVQLSSERYAETLRDLSEREFSLLLNSVLCPHFNLIPSPYNKSLEARDRMNQMLREQYRLLDFLEEQDCAVINGAAGTGKTMLATEKARRHSINGERVLFLCYNKLLCDSLNRLHKQSPTEEYRQQFRNVDFMTISKLIKQVTGNHLDFEGLNRWLDSCMANPSSFPYRHIIIDEGQDFGLIDAEAGRDMAVETCSVVDSLMLLAQETQGTFYLYYDKYQMIQGRSNVDYPLPDCIENCDCRLTLRANCRNTREIAKTSVTPLRDQKNRAIKVDTACKWEIPVKPVMHLTHSTERTVQILNGILETYAADGVRDVVILTGEAIEHSSAAEHFHYQSQNGGYVYSYQRKEYTVTTCKKFKGLEADAVILIDLNKDSFTGKNGMQFYVGASRAKYRLDMICALPETDYAEVIRSVAPNAPRTANLARLRTILGNAFGAKIVTD